MAQLSVTLVEVSHRDKRKHIFASPVITTVGIGTSYIITPSEVGSVILDNETQTEYTITESVEIISERLAAITPVAVTMSDTASIDAFARLRVSNPHTLFDSKQLNDNLSTRWDDQEVSGSGTSSTYNINQSSSTLAVSNLTVGKRVRQTFMRFNYQPAKSLLVFMTTTVGMLGGGTGITRSLGQFDDKNGIFFRDSEGVLQVGIRSYVTGTAVDRVVAQADWNLDTMDGNGTSGMTVDPTKSQIIFFDYEWLGVGRVRMGFVNNGIPTYCHEFLNSNTTLSTVYMTTPNNPLRYEIENDGTGTESSIDHICCSVISEGGQQELGITHYHSTAGVHVDANVANTLYAVVGIRLKQTHLDCVVKELTSSMLEETKADFEWLLMMNPTVAGTFNYTDHADSAVQVATGATVNTVTGGHEVTGGFASSTVALSAVLPSAIYMGSTIAGVSDELVLCARPLSANADIQGGINWRELT